LRVGNWYGGTIELNGQNHTEFYGSAGFKIDANPNFYLIGKSTGVLSWNGTRFEFGGNNASANGYTTLNNGFIIQWGYCGANNGGSTRATFPITFSSVFAICDTQYAGADIGVYDSNCYILSKDTSGFTFRTDNSNAKIHWIAIGV